MNTLEMVFDWDIDKERANIRRHNIDFDTAALVFGDPFRLEKLDAVHSDDEERLITIGRVNGTVLLITVVYTMRSEVVRIISARKATRAEREEYNYDRNQKD